MKIRTLLFLVSLCAWVSSSYADPSQRKFVIITDLEPDDRIAIQLIGAYFQADQIALVGTSVMHAATKRVLTERLLGQLGLGSVPVYQGTGGVASSYPDIASSKAAREFDQIGKGILPDDELASLNHLPLAGDDFQTHLRQALKSNPGIEIVLLAPPTDLVAVLEQDPSLKRNIGHIHLMGGWLAANGPDGTPVLWSTYNWNMDPVSSAKLMAMDDIPMTLYSSHMIKPSFAGGSINASNHPKIIDLLEKLASTLPSVAEGLEAEATWDHYIIEKIPSLGPVLGPFAGKQFTPADPTVVVGMVSPGFTQSSYTGSIKIDPSEVDRSKGFRVTVSPSITSKIEIVEKVDSQVFEDQVLAGFSRLPEVISARNGRNPAASRHSPAWKAHSPSRPAKPSVAAP